MWTLLKRDADVDGRRRAVAKHNAENLFVKKGLAMAACRHVMNVGAKPAIVSIHHDGTVHVTSAGHEMGQVRQETEFFISSPIFFSRFVFLPPSFFFCSSQHHHTTTTSSVSPSLSLPLPLSLSLSSLSLSLLSLSPCLSLSLSPPPLSLSLPLSLFFFSFSLSSKSTATQGIHTKVLQAANLALSSAQPAGTPPLPMSLFHHADSSTDALPNCGPSWASTTSEAASEAVRQAASKLAESLRDRFVVDDPEKPGSKKTLTWLEVIESVHPSFPFSASNIPLTAYSFYDGTERHAAGRGKSALSYNGYGVAVTEAEVDALTGEVRIARADIVLDAGASLNPALDSGQIEGGYVQGLGLALSEAVRVNPRTGACATSTWQYKVPTADSCPRALHVHLLPSAKHARGVLSSKAVGEPPLLLASTALCAVQAACDAAREGFAARVAGGGGGGGSAAAAAPAAAQLLNGTIENRSRDGPTLAAPRTLLTAPATPAAVKAAIGLVPLAEMVAGGPAGKL